MQVKRFNADMTPAPGPGNTLGQVNMYNTLTNRLQGFADRKNKIADKEVATEGERMGKAAAAGTIGGVEIPEDNTIRGEAFAAGARLAHAAQIQIDVRENVAKYEQDHQFDAQGFSKNMEGYREGLLSEIDEQLRPMAINEINDYSLRSRIRIEDNMFKKATTEQVASITTASEGMETDALNAAYQGDEDMLMNKQAQYFMLLDTGADQNIFDKAKVEELKRNFNDDIEVQNVTGVFDRTIQNEGIDAAEKSYSHFVKSKHPGVNPVVKDKIISRMRSSMSEERAKIRSQLTRNKAEISAREKALKRDVDNAEYALDHGYQVPNIAELIDVSRGTKYEKDLRLVQIHQDAVNEFVQESPSAQTTYLNALGNKNLSGEQIRLVERLKKVNDYTEGELRTGRGMDLALEQGIITDLPPLEAPGALQARKQLAQIAGEHYEQPITPLTDGEITTLKANLDSASSDDRILTLGQLVDGLGEDVLPTLESLASKNSGTYAVAGSMMVDGQGHAGREMLRGIDARKAYPKIIPTDFDTTFTAAIGSTYSRSPKQVEILRDAVKNLYAQQSVNSAKYEEAVVDTNMLDDVINVTTNGIYKIKNQGSGTVWDDQYNIEAPAQGVDQDQFIDWMENLTEDEIRGMGATAIVPELTKAINEQKVELVTLGNGQYQVIRNGLPAVNEDLSPFILRWDQ